MAIRSGLNEANKAYVVLFLCFSTKAIHLELVTDLTTTELIAASRRFDRRGRPSVIYEMKLKMK